MRIYVAALLVIFGFIGSGAALADPPKTGEFELVFTKRNPLSDLKTLTKRFQLGAKPVGRPGVAPAPASPITDYDLSAEHFMVHVPKNYDGSKPLGLIVLGIYKHAEQLPAAILPELDAVNVALIVPQEYQDFWWQRAGVDLDAAYNMEQLYSIDPKQVYIFGGGDDLDKDGKEVTAASRVGLNFPEVFTGTFSTTIYSYRPVSAGRNSVYPPEIPHPEAAQFTMAKMRPIVYGVEREDAGRKLFFASYKADGFKYMLSIPVTQEQFHYPMFQTGWIPDVLKFMDASTANLKLPTTMPSTQPAKGG